MSGAEVIQILAKGRQDNDITGRSEITWFRSMYKKPTHHAMVPAELQFAGVVDFGRKPHCVIDRSADLVGPMTLKATLPAITADGLGAGLSWVNEVGHKLVDKVTLKVGSAVVDEHTGLWLSLWSKMSLPAGKVAGYNNMIGNVSALTGAFPAFAAAAGATIPETTIHVPMQFTFNRESGAYLPLIALPRSQVRLEFEFSPLNELIRGDIDSGSYSIQSAVVVVEYVHLEEPERAAIVARPNRMLFEQVQEAGQEFVSGTVHTIKPDLAHPTKLLAWVLRRSDNQDPSANTNMDWFNFTDATGSTGDDPLVNASISFSNKKRVEEISADYFRDYQAYYFHENSGNPGLYSYSYALHPLKYGPSGTMNYSAIDTSQVRFTVDAGLSAVDKTVDLYALNYNVLLIARGVGGVGYAA